MPLGNALSHVALNSTSGEDEYYFRQRHQMVHSIQLCAIWYDFQGFYAEQFWCTYSYDCTFPFDDHDTISAIALDLASLRTRSSLDLLKAAWSNVLVFKKWIWAPKYQYFWLALATLELSWIMQQEEFTEHSWPWSRILVVVRYGKLNNESSATQNSRCKTQLAWVMWNLNFYSEHSEANHVM